MPPNSTTRRHLVAVVRVSIVVGVALLFTFLAWRSSPRLGELHWLPRTLTRWADHHGVARNVVGFFFFGAVFFAFLGRSWPLVLLAAFFATILEIAQLWVPHRIFDRKDIYASLLGLALAWIVVAGVARALRTPARQC